MSSDLLKKKCKPCEGGVSPLSHDQIKPLLSEVQGWELTDGKAIQKIITCKDFLDAVALVQEIAPIAEADNHHPDLHLFRYKRLRIELFTHAINGLSENDFILAAKIDALLSKRS